jgi:TPR repeat protein
VAADLYQSAAAHGDVFGQSRLGLSYDRGHGVPQSVVFSYAWLNLAAAGASGRQADYYRRLRDAVASKMTAAQIFEGQRLALIWAAPPPAP